MTVAGALGNWNNWLQREAAMETTARGYARRVGGCLAGLAVFVIVLALRDLTNGVQQPEGLRSVAEGMIVLGFLMAPMAAMSGIVTLSIYNSSGPQARRTLPFEPTLATSPADVSVDEVDAAIEVLFRRGYSRVDNLRNGRSITLAIGVPALFLFVAGSLILVAT